MPAAVQTLEMDLGHVPNLPGFGFRTKQKNCLRPQTFQMVNGVRVECQEGVTHERPKFVQVPRPADPRRHGSFGKSVTTEDYVEQSETRLTQLPAWDALDRHVLRFYGFFKEAVVEANLENFRIRHCSVMYYLEDDTCQVYERKMDNSGIPQGGLIRRHRFPGPDGGYLKWEDLLVGEPLQIYGRSIQLADCDAWTRQFYLDQGMEQAPGEPQEQDAFMVTNVKKLGGPTGIPRTAERLYREVELGGGHVNTDMQQFLEWDRKVCRFYAIVDDLKTPQFERRPFMLLYFLADDTVEIREQYPLNCGRDNFPIFFRRSRVSKGTVEVRGPLDPPKSKDQYVNAMDFAVGQTISMLGFTFFIYDADEFTRQYYAEELNAPLDPVLDVRLPERAVPRPATPPYTGYGSWQDSLGSVHSLMPKQPKRDMVKLFSKAGQVLRFTAQLHNAKLEDQDRLFVVNFHLFDDTLSVHEPPQRNLGIVTGRFLEKGIHMNQQTGQLFSQEDLYPGAIIKVYNRAFEIIDCDEYTRNHMASGGNKRMWDLPAVLEKLREGMRQQSPLVRDIFRKFDTDKNGVLTFSEFKDALHKWGYQLTEQEALIIMKHFDTRQDGQISYNEFCDVLLDEDYTQHMLKTKPPLDAVFDPAYAARAQQRSAERQETESVRTAVRAVGEVIYKQTQLFSKLFKEFSHMTHRETVSWEQIHEALLQMGHRFEPEDIRRTVLYVMPEVDPSQVPYVQFLKAMVTSFHDVSANR